MTRYIIDTDEMSICIPNLDDAIQQVMEWTRCAIIWEDVDAQDAIDHLAPGTVATAEQLDYFWKNGAARYMQERSTEYGCELLMELVQDALDDGVFGEEQ